MSDKKVWFITGAGRGMGVDIAHYRDLSSSLAVVEPELAGAAK
jgi:hypothetical protein